jgi:peptide/nickel transport system substrate-binding protein
MVQRSPIQRFPKGTDVTSNLSRRNFLVVGGGGLTAALLAACGGVSSSNTVSTPSASAAGTARRGGTLRVGSIGGNTDTLDAHFTGSDMDQQRAQNLYDSLKYLAADLPYRTEYGLAESIELNPAATVATVRLKSGVEFHNGKSLTVEDLIFSLQRILNPSKPGKAATALAAIDLNNMKKLDNLTLRLNLGSPDSMFSLRWGSAQTSIVPVGYNPAKPVGTGPFKLQSFTPGARSVFVRNPNYWVSGEPYLDQVEIIDFADNTSRMAALLSGQVDAVDGVDPSVLKQVPSSGYTSMITKSAFYQPITMRVDMAPFNDVRVRQAFRLMVDRPQMVAQAYSGYGRVANDMPFGVDPDFPDFPQRVQDIPQAKALLKAAGHEGLAVTFTTAPENGGLVATAQVFAQQAAAAGVKVTVSNLTPTAYDAGYKSWPFTNGYWAANIMGTGYSGRFLKGGGQNDSHWDDPAGTAIYHNLLKTTDPAKQKVFAAELFKRFYDEGPDIIHSFKNGIDVYSSKFSGFQPFNSNGWSLGSWRYREIWQAG